MSGSRPFAAHALRRGRGEFGWLLLSAGFFLTFLLLPLLLLFKTGLSIDGVPSLTPLQDVLDSRSVPKALWHSLESAFFSAVLSLFAGSLLALLIGLTSIRAKPLWVFLILLPMMIPPHVTAIAWIQALGPASTLLQTLGVAPELGSTHPLYSRGGVIFLLAVQHTPLVFLLVLTAIRTLPSELADAARVCGANAWQLIGRVLLPLLAPTLLAAWMVALISALGNFAIPALLGIPARYITLPVLIWQRLASFGPTVLNTVSVLALMLAIAAIVLITLQFVVLKHLRNPVTGLSRHALHLPLGRWRGWLEAALLMIITLVLVFPLMSLITTALIPTYGVPLSLNTLTFDNFTEVLFRQSVTLRAFANSTLVATIAAAIIVLLSILLTHMLQSPRRFVKGSARLATGLAEISYAVPGIVISIAFILAFIKPLPLLNVSLYGTLGIILCAYLCAFFSVGLKPVLAAAVQLDPALDEAARVSGAGFTTRLLHISAPLLLPSALAGAILVFLISYNEITVSALLWSNGSETIGSVIYNYEDGGATTIAAAMATVTVLITALLMLALERLGRRLPRGVIPWQH